MHISWDILYETSKLHITDPLLRSPPVINGFPTQMISNGKNGLHVDISSWTIGMPYDKNTLV